MIKYAMDGLAHLDRVIIRRQGGELLQRGKQFDLNM